MSRRNGGLAKNSKYFHFYQVFSSSTVNSQQHRQQTTDNSRSTPVPVLIIGKPLLNRLMKSLGSPFSEPLGPKDNVSELVVVSEEASYFKVSLYSFGFSIIFVIAPSGRPNELYQRMSEGRQEWPHDDRRKLAP